MLTVPIPQISQRGGRPVSESGKDISNYHSTTKESIGEVWLSIAS
jgi:hypothetical protein